MIKKRGQAAVESAMLFSFMLLVLVVFSMSISTKFVGIREDKDKKLLQDVGSIVKSEFDLAAGAERGYVRYFTLPQTLLGRNYTAQIVSSEVMHANFSTLSVQYTGYLPGNELVITLPKNVSGSPCMGMNLLEKKDQELRVVCVQCSDGVDNDNSGCKDYPQDPGCDSPHDLIESGIGSCRPACADNADNPDGDNCIDLRDPGCTDVADNSEDPWNSRCACLNPPERTLESDCVQMTDLQRCVNGNIIEDCSCGTGNCELTYGPGWICRLSDRQCVNAAFNCIAKSSCGPAEVALMNLSEPADAHAAKGGTYASQLQLCCTSNIDTLSNAVTGAVVLKLHQEENAHVQRADYPGSDYPVPVYIAADSGYFSCSYLPYSCGSATCVASLSGDTNAHLGSCTDYDLKVCCRYTYIEP